MVLSKVRWTVVIALLVAGVYFLVFHKDPLPANHEAIGLGTVHILHDAIGIVLLAVVGYLWWSARKQSKSQMPAASGPA